MNDKPPKVSIIILNWNGLKDTIECLESVRKIDYPNYEIILVDNGSRDGSPQELERIFPEIILLKNKENLGYTGGNNVGIRCALDKGSDYILLLNNDTIVDSQMLQSFIMAANLYPDAGIYGAKIYYYSKKNKIRFAGAKLSRNNFYFSFIGRGEEDSDEKFNKIIEIDFANGSAFFIKNEVFLKAGLLDTEYFLNYEEIDFCYRARRVGFKCMLVPQAKAWHKGTVAFGGPASPMYIYFIIRNKLLWAKKNLSFSQRWRVYISIAGEFFPSLFWADGFPSIKRIYGDMINLLKNYKKPQFKATIIGIRDFVLRRFGNCPNSISVLNDKYVGNKL